MKTVAYRDRHEVPTPKYEARVRGIGVRFFEKGEAADALRWIANKSFDCAIFAHVLGSEAREIARGEGRPVRF
jgi:hypothetical protein